MSDKNVLIQVKDLKKAFGTNQVLDGITTDICQGRSSSRHLVLPVPVNLLS